MHLKYYDHEHTIIMVPPKVYFQIGTNDGNDNFRSMVINEKPDIVILVEPNTGLIDAIQRNYASIPNVYIYNNAIYYTNNEELELYIPAKNAIMGTRADNGHTYTDVNFSLVPMNDWGSKDDMVKIITRSITFDEICRIHNISKIDYLQIDTEGFDTEIIKMIDMDKITINRLRFEKWGFDPSNFTKYNNDIAINMGKNGMDATFQKLQKYNYDIADIKDKDGDDIIAIFRG